MPSLSKNAHDENEEPLAGKVEDFLPNLVISTKPVVICGVSRRVGLAHFEHIDLYCGVGIPVDYNEGDIEGLKEAIAEAAMMGFNATSAETYERYKLLKNIQEVPPAE